MFTARPTPAFNKWLRGLKDTVARKRIAARIVRLQSGLFGDCRSIGGQVSELRVDHGPGYRVYFTVRGEEVVILLCGGDKSSQARDIATAKEMAAQLD